MEFLSEQMRCSCDGNAIHIAYPLLLPDGWQIAFSLYDLAEGCVCELSDDGKITEFLQNYFPKYSPEIKLFIRQKCEFYGIENCEWYFRKQFNAIPSAKDIHLFAEGLLAISYLVYRFEKRTDYDDAPFRTVREIFISCNREVKTDVCLHGKHHSRIHVDIQSGKSIVRILSTRNPLQALQITGFQFNDYRMANPATERILIYNPDRKWSEDCQSLADCGEYFDFAASYQEPDKIRDYVQSIDQ